MTSSLALADHLLNVEERSWGTTFARVAAAAWVGLLIAFGLLAAGQSDAPGRLTLSVIAWGNLFALGVAGGALFAPLLSNQQTGDELPLLLLAGRSPAALLAALTGPRALVAIGMVVVQLPAAVLATTLGGATVAEAASLLAVLCVAAVVFGAIGMAVGLLARTALAVTWNLIVFHVAWLMATNFMAELSVAAGADRWISATRCSHPAGLISATLRGQSVDPLLFLVLSSLIVGGCVFVSLRAVSRPPRRPPTQGGARPWSMSRFDGRGWEGGSRRVTGDPLAWKDHWAAGGPDAVWGRIPLCFCLAPFVVVPLTLIGSRMGIGHAGWQLGMAAVLGFEAAGVGTRLIQSERDTGSWPLLRLHPSSPLNTLRRKFCGGGRTLVFPVLIFLFVTAFVMWVSILRRADLFVGALLSLSSSSVCLALAALLAARGVRAARAIAFVLGLGGGWSIAVATATCSGLLTEVRLRPSELNWIVASTAAFLFGITAWVWKRLPNEMDAMPPPQS